MALAGEAKSFLLGIATSVFRPDGSGYEGVRRPYHVYLDKTQDRKLTPNARNICLASGALDPRSRRSGCAAGRSHTMCSWHHGTLGLAPNKQPGEPRPTAYRAGILWFSISSGSQSVASSVVVLQDRTRHLSSCQGGPRSDARARRRTSCQT